MALHLVLANCLLFLALGIMLTSYTYKDQIKMLNKEIDRGYREAEELREQLYLLTQSFPIRRK